MTKMLKCQTRKELIERLKGLICISSERPALAFVIEDIDFEGYYELEWDRYHSLGKYYGLNGIVSKLMDLSLTHRIAKIHCHEFMSVRGMWVFFDVFESKDGTTNIDSEIMDLILRLNCTKA